MGLISTVSKGLGVVKNKTSTALGVVKAKGAVVAQKVSKVPVLGGAVKLAGKVIRSPVGKLGVRVGTKAIPVVGAITTVAGVASFIKNRRDKKSASKSASTVVASSKIGSKAPGLLGKVAKGAGIAGLVAGGLYAGEQIAEKLGVRGGAGFIGRRTSRRRRKKKYAYIKVRRNRYGKGSLTKSEESRLRSIARKYEASEGTSRTRRRKRPYPYHLKKYMFKKGHRRRR